MGVKVFKYLVYFLWSKEEIKFFIENYMDSK